MTPFGGREGLSALAAEGVAPGPRQSPFLRQDVAFVLKCKQCAYLSCHPSLSLRMTGLTLRMTTSFPPPQAAGIDLTKEFRSSLTKSFKIIKNFLDTPIIICYHLRMSLWGNVFFHFHGIICICRLLSGNNILDSPKL